MKFLIVLLTGTLLVSCSSTKKEREVEEREHEEIERDYVVRDSSSKYRPGWIEDPEVWASNHGKDIKKDRFFSYESDPKVSRTIACKIAKANAKSDIAAEITTFIDKSLATSIEGDSNIDENDPNVKNLKEYVEDTLVEKVQSLIYGAQIVKTYWEKRKYLKDKGAKKDFTAYTCATFLRMNAKRLAKSVDDAANLVADRAKSKVLKDNVKEALKNASENFVNAKKGEI